VATIGAAGVSAEALDFHRQLFANSREPLRHEIKRTTGVEVREVVPTTGTAVQAFQLAHSDPTENWSGNGTG
jgi:hypothetical protein